MRKKCFAILAAGTLCIMVGCSNTATKDNGKITAEPQVTQSATDPVSETESESPEPAKETVQAETGETQEPELIEETSTSKAENKTDDMTETESEFAGEYRDQNGDSGLIIEKKDDGYHIEIGITRLTYIDDGVGTLDGDKIKFTATDASGSPIEGEIEKTDTGADVVFTNSTWEYIENGERFSYIMK